MKTKDLEQSLRHALHQPAISVNERHFTDTCLLAGIEADRQKNRERITFWSFLSMQIRFVGWKIWLVQGLFLLFISHLFIRVFGTVYLENPFYMAKLLFCVSVLVFMSALPLIYRSVRCRMQEIEAAARFSSVMLLMAKLVIIGIGDLFLLSGIFCITVWKTPLQAGSVILYLCFPFLLAGSFCLFLLGRLPAKTFFTSSMSLCAFLLLAAAASRHALLPFYRSFTAGWIIICVALAAFCVRQFYYILHDSPYAEMQLS